MPAGDYPIADRRNGIGTRSPQEALRRQDSRGDRMFDGLLAVSPERLTLTGDEGGRADSETHGQQRHCLRLTGACPRRCIQLNLPLLRAINGLTLVDTWHDPVNGLRYQASNGHHGDQDSLIKHFTSAGALAKGHCGASVVVGRRFACQLPARISGTVVADPSLTRSMSSTLLPFLF